MKTILVIEDEPVMRENLATLLELEGYRVSTAANGREGLELAHHSPPDLILCDVMMPALDGYGVLRALQVDPVTAQIPFIFLTAKGEQSEVRAGMNLGADDYLVKPVRKGDLLEAIVVRLERHRVLQFQTQFRPDFTSAAPLERLGLTPREAEVLLWIAQGKGNADVGTILAMSEGTVKKHVLHIFEKLGVESRSAAALVAFETLPKT